MKYKELADISLHHMEVDYMPLHDIVREFTRNNQRPTRSEFELALEFLEKFLENNSIKVLHGKDMREIDKKRPAQVIHWLRELWNDENYEDFNYAVWFDKA